MTVNFALSVNADAKDLKAMGMLKGEPRALKIDPSGKIIDNPSDPATWTIRIFFRRAASNPTALDKTPFIGWADVPFEYDGDFVDPISGKRTIKLKHDSAPITITGIPTGLKFYPDETELGAWDICGFAGGAQWAKNADGTPNYRRVTYTYDPAIDDQLAPDQVRAPLVFPWTSYRPKNETDALNVTLKPFGSIIRLKLGHSLSGSEDFMLKRLFIRTNCYANSGVFSVGDENRNLTGQAVSSRPPAQYLTDWYTNYNWGSFASFSWGWKRDPWSAAQNPGSSYYVYPMYFETIEGSSTETVYGFLNYGQTRYQRWMSFNPRTGHEKLSKGSANNEMLIWVAPATSRTVGMTQKNETAVFMEEAGSYSEPPSGGASDRANHTHMYFTSHVPKLDAITAETNRLTHGKYYTLTAMAEHPVRLPIEYVADYNLAGGVNTSYGPVVNQGIYVGSATQTYLHKALFYGEQGNLLRMANRDKDNPTTAVNPNTPWANDQSGYYSSELLYGRNHSLTNPGTATLLELEAVDDDGQLLGQLGDKYFIPELKNWWCIFPGGVKSHWTDFWTQTAVSNNQVDAVQIGGQEVNQAAPADRTLNLSFTSYYSASYARPGTPTNSRTVYAVRFMKAAGGEHKYPDTGWGAYSSSNYDNYERYPAWDNNLFACAYRYRRMGTMTTNNNLTDHIQVDVVYLGNSATTATFTQIQSESWWAARAAKTITKRFPLTGVLRSSRVASAPTSVSTMFADTQYTPGRCLHLAGMGWYVNASPVSSNYSYLFHYTMNESGTYTGYNMAGGTDFRAIRLFIKHPELNANF